MWSNFQKLGKQPSAKEEAVARKILETLKKNIGKGGRFFKKEVRSNELYEVGEEVALISEYISYHICALNDWYFGCVGTHLKNLVFV